MKKLSLFMLVICMMATLPASAQFGKLLDKAKGAVSGGKAGKKNRKFCYCLGI